MLTHLRRAGLPVTAAVPTVDGEPFLSGHAPEGRRQLLLDYAEGRLVRGGRTKGRKPSVVEVVEQYAALAAPSTPPPTGSPIRTRGWPSMSST